MYLSTQTLFCLVTKMIPDSMAFNKLIIDTKYLFQTDQIMQKNFTNVGTKKTISIVYYLIIRPIISLTYFLIISGVHYCGLHYKQFLVRLGWIIRQRNDAKRQLLTYNVWKINVQKLVVLKTMTTYLIVELKKESNSLN